MAFVIAPPPSAQSAGALASLFAGATPMPVREAAPRTVVKPNHVYVIPPDTPMRIVHSVMALAPRSEAGPARQPVDYFFRSLAADRRALGIGLMLSPADADDITGLQAIRANGGIAIIQNEDSAGSCSGSSTVPPGVTRGIADLILSPEEIGDALERIGRTTDSSRATAPLAHDLPVSANKEMSRELAASRQKLGSGNQELPSTTGCGIASAYDSVNLIGGASIPVLMVDSELRIKLVTPGAERVFNVRASDAGNHVRDIRLRLNEGDLESRIRRVIDRRAAEEIELPVRDRRCHLLRIDPCLGRDGRIEGAVITALDLDEVRQTRNAAVQAGRFADAVLESVAIPLLVLDADLKILVANGGFLAAYRLQSADVQNCMIEDVGSAPWGTPEFEAAMRRLLSGETAFEELECLQDHPGFGQRAVLINGRRIIWQGGARILIAIHDITAQRRAEALMVTEKAHLKRTARKAAAALQESEDALRQSRAELRALTGSLLHAQEEERRRVSRELHDDVSQDVVKLQFDIEALEQALPPERTKEKQGLMAVRDDAARLSNDLRRIAYVLHPSTLDNLGLTGALSAYAAEFSKRTGIPVQFTTSGVPEIIPQGIASAFYRITQEALRNIVRHSGAASSLRLTGENSHLNLAIHDRGPGFDRHAVRGRGGLGLVSMEERARLIGANFQIATAPGEGVSIKLSAPLGGLD
jgi:signal transduction histidine kinase